MRKLNLISIKQLGKPGVNIKYTNNMGERSPAPADTGREGKVGGEL